MEKPDITTRRDFIKTAGLAGAGAVLLSASSTLLTGCSTLGYVRQATLVPKAAYSVNNGSIELDISQVPELLSVGGSATIEEESLSNYLLIARTSETSFTVVSSECTHREKALAYEHEDAIFHCSSIGGSKFRLDGDKISGPAEKSLRVYKTSFTQGVLGISL